MSKAKKSPYDKAFIELWENAAKKTPAVHGKKENPCLFSSVLLIHDKERGVLPGFYVKWNQDHFFGDDRQIKAGDAYYVSMKDEILTNVLYFYQVNKLPVHSETEPEPEKETAPVE